MNRNFPQTDPLSGPFLLLCKIFASFSVRFQLSKELQILKLSTDDSYFQLVKYSYANSGQATRSSPSEIYKCWWNKTLSHYLSFSQRKRFSLYDILQSYGNSLLFQLPWMVLSADNPSFHVVGEKLDASDEVL